MKHYIKTLYETEWLSLKKIVLKDQSVYSDYVFSHETRCDGKVVVILPYRIQQGRLEFLLRSEVVPCWDIEHQSICAITGGVDHGDTPGQAAVTELLEEAGYSITKNQLIPLGQSRGTKSTDTVYIMFSVDLTDLLELTPSTEPGYCFWTEDVSASVDPMVFAAYHQLQLLISKNK